jgi:hypothetical protein
VSTTVVKEKLRHDDGPRAGTAALAPIVVDAISGGECVGTRRFAADMAGRRQFEEARRWVKGHPSLIKTS